jgi:predicted MFS family arabinose efflux permease
MTSLQIGLAVLLALYVGLVNQSTTVIFALLILSSIAASLVGPAFQALLPELVDRSAITAAVALAGLQFNVGRVLGPTIAAVIISALGYSAAFAFNALSFVGIIIVLGLFRVGQPRTSSRYGGGGALNAPAGNVEQSPQETSVVRGNRSEVLPILGIGVIGLLLSPFIALIPARAVLSLKAGATGTSILTTSQGIGAISGALLVSWLVGRIGALRGWLAASLLLCAALIVYALSEEIWLAALGIALAGGLYAISIAIPMSVIQATPHAERRGRALGIFDAVFTCAYAGGALVQGGLGDRFGLQAVTALASLLFVLIALGFTVLERRSLAKRQWIST